MKIIVIVLAVFLLFGCDKKPEEAYIHFKEGNIEVYEQVFLSDQIKDTNVKIKDILLDTSTLEEKKITFSYTYQNKEYNGTYTYQVMDTTSPKIFGGGEKTIEKGKSIDPCNMLMYGDNYDSEPICYIDGSYDINNIGSYKIRVKVKDAAGNMASHGLTLNVVEKIESNPSSNYSKKFAFQDAYQKYKTKDSELGIDVSEWQGEVDYKKVKDAGATFVMMRIGYTPRHGEDSIMDGQFKRNIKLAKEAGLKVGVYLYSKALSKEEAEKEAKWVLKMLNNETLDFPIAFDWEIWSNWNSYHLSFHELNEISKAFIKTVEGQGYQGSIYGSKFYLENLWDQTYQHTWLAHYIDETNYNGNYYMWQFSNQGRIDGIYGDVDMNVLYQ